MSNQESLFALAVKARLPLIAVQTSDTLHAMAVIEYIVGSEVPVESNVTSLSLRKYDEDVVVLHIEKPSELSELYATAKELGKSFILVNPDLTSDEDELFDAGSLPTPPEMVEQLIKDLFSLDDVPNAFLSVLGGMTLKEVEETCLLAIAKFGTLTSEGLMKLRSIHATRIRGLEQVGLSMPCYLPDEQIEAWLKLNKSPFLDVIDPQLVPRGLLLNGLPGVGKTSACKNVASKLGIPLYRMDIASMLDKWQGEAERFLRAALDQIDKEEPCVLLIDEVEKIFQSDEGDSGSTSRMLSKLLWWLQEHESRVLTMMTTNDFSKLPPEVYRPGRIDKVVELQPLQHKAAIELAKAVYMSLSAEVQNKVPQSKVVPKVRKWMESTGTEDRYTHSAVTTTVIEIVKGVLTQ